jgi:two-component system, cell cycle sensor histidine kinase and response regulator CckA
VSSPDYRALFDGNPNPIVVLDLESRTLLAVNDAACAHFGYERSELVGRDASMLRPPEDVEAMRDAFVKHGTVNGYSGPAPFGGIWRHQRKDGSIRHVEIWRVRVEYEGRRASLIIITDVSERVLTEAALRDSQEKWRAIVQHSADYIVELDSGDIIRSVNQPSASRLIGTPFLELMPQARRERTARCLSAARQTGTMQRLESQRTEETGQPRFYDTRFIPLERDGAVRGVLCVTTDITERKRLEEQLRHAQKMEATGLLAGGVAHDFNNLLGVVVGCTELARTAARAGAPFEEQLDSIEEAAQRAAELTRKLLAFSRKQVLRVQPLDLGAAVNDFLGVLRRVVGEGIELEVRRPAEPLVVVADVLQIEQVLLNLCMNARQAIPTVGRIVVETLPARLSADEAAPVLAGDFVEIRVTDTGAGMDAATQAHAFEPFFTTKGEGMGLGLAMVHGIVHQHGGTTRIESRPGEGTTVRVFLPVSRDAPEASRTPAPTVDAQPRGGSETILVAEDEPALRKVIARTLEALGYAVVTTENGEQAAREFEARRGQFGLAILDIVMPVLGGVQAYERMRCVAPAVNVLFTTGYAPDNAQVSDLVTRGRHAVLRKPFTLAELGSKVRELLDAHS